MNLKFFKYYAYPQDSVNKFMIILNYFNLVYKTYYKKVINLLYDVSKVIPNLQQQMNNHK